MSIRPPKLLPIQITSISPVANWTADDGTGDPYLNQPYRWTVTFGVTAQPHSYHLSPTPRFWTGSDVQVGDWIASAPGGIANRVVSITAKSATSVTAVVEDVDRFNTFADPQGLGIGIGPTGAGYCFELGDDGLPILTPAKPGTLPFDFQVDLISRFRHRNLIRSFVRVNQPSVAFQSGDPIYLKADGTYALATTAMPASSQVIGIVREVHTYSDHAADWFAYKPVGEIIQSITPPLPGNPGDLVYLGATGFTVTPPAENPKPVYIRLETGSRGILLNRGSALASSGGGGGGDSLAVTVDHTSVSPVEVGLVPGDTRVTLVSAEVLEGFDSPQATLTVGDDLSPARLMDDPHNDLTQTDIYETTAPYLYKTPTAVKVYFDFRDSTQGEVTVTITYS